MIESYLSTYMHPNRVGDILSVINDLSHLGLDQVGQTVENFIMSGSVSGSDGVIGDIEQIIEVALKATFTQFGVSISYDDSRIAEHLAVLNFLAQWDTPEGYSKRSVNLPNGLDELGRSDKDKLLELIAMATGEMSYSFIDWVDSVEGYLIKVINSSLMSDDEDDTPDDEAGILTQSILNPFRSFAAHYGDSEPVKYVTNGGAFGIGFERLIEANDDVFLMSDEDGYATNVVGFALLSNMPRQHLVNAVAHFIELTYGPTDQARRVISKAQLILTNIGL